MEVKKHFKLFKAGKNWCVMAIAVAAVATGTAMGAQTAHADTTPSTPGTTMVTSSAPAAQVTSNAANTSAQPAANGAASSAPADPPAASNAQPVDYQTPVNAGQLSQTTADQGNVVFNGWHATNQYRSGMDHFVIALNGSNNQEIYRSKVTVVPSSAAGQAYPKAPISTNGGFSFALPADKLNNVSSLKLVSRYTFQANGNPAAGADYWYPTISTKAGYLDQFKVTGNTITVSGWHADDMAAKYPTHYLILIDQTTGKEVSRQIVTNDHSNDVAQAGYDTIVNAQDARFSAKFTIQPSMLGHTFRLISRYSTPELVNQQYSDYDYANTLRLGNRQAAWLDTFRVDGANDQIKVSGWHAADGTAIYPTHFLILFDQTKNREVAHQIVKNLASPDVAKAEGQIANAGNARFSTNFKVTPEMVGDQFVLVSRYSDSTDVNSYGHYIDYWYGNKINLNQNQAYLDNFSVNGTKINVSGWHVDDQALNHTHHFLILFDQTKNHEVARQEVKDQASPDIAQNNSLGTALNAGNARFNATFNVEPGMLGDHFVLISRYSDKANGEGNYSQNWIANKNLQLNHKQAGYLDNFKVAGDNIIVSGWHADDASAVAPTHFIILFDKTKNHEVGHQLVKLTASPDVAKVEGQIANAGNARFSTSFKLSPDMIGDQFVVVSRYSNSPDGNSYGSSYSDYWYGNQLNLNQNQAWLDNFSQSGTRIDVSGWHADDYSMTDPYHYLILWDLTTGKEVGRQRVDTVASPDIVNVHGDIINADKARFSASFNIPGNIQGHAFQIISRYSSDANGGEGNRSDNWINNRFLNVYQNPGWMYQINYSQIQATGPVGHNIGPGYEGIKTWLIKRQLGTANIHNQYSYYDASLVKNVQRNHGLPQTGWVDFNTWKALGLQPSLWTAIDSYVSPLAVGPGQGRSAHIEAMINQAYKYMGQPWLAGCSSMPGYGVDCSGLVMQSLYAAGINPTSCSSIYHGFPGNEWNSRQLFNDPHFMNVSWNDRQRGDLVFYYEPGTHIIIHVAIYLGNNQVIESWPPCVMVQPIMNGQRSVIAGIRRVFA